MQFLSAIDNLDYHSSKNNTEHSAGYDTKTSCVETLHRKCKTNSEPYVPKRH